MRSEVKRRIRKERVKTEGAERGQGKGCQEESRVERSKKQEAREEKREKEKEERGTECGGQGGIKNYELRAKRKSLGKWMNGDGGQGRDEYLTLRLRELLWQRERKKERLNSVNWCGDLPDPGETNQERAIALAGLLLLKCAIRITAL